MKNRLFFFALMLLGMTSGGVVGANVSAPKLAYSAETQQLSEAQIRALIDAIQTALLKSPAKNPDRAYLEGMAAVEPIVLALCKKEIDDGKADDVKVEAAHILTVEQEYEARTKDLEREFGITHD